MNPLEMAWPCESTLSGYFNVILLDFPCLIFLWILGVSVPLWSTIQTQDCLSS